MDFLVSRVPRATADVRNLDRRNPAADFLFEIETRCTGVHLLAPHVCSRNWVPDQRYSLRYYSQVRLYLSLCNFFEDKN